MPPTGAVDSPAVCAFSYACVSRIGRSRVAGILEPDKSVSSGLSRGAAALSMANVEKSLEWRRRPAAQFYNKRHGEAHKAQHVVVRKLGIVVRV